MAGHILNQTQYPAEDPRRLYELSGKIQGRTGRFLHPELVAKVLGGKLLEAWQVLGRLYYEVSYPGELGRN